MADYDQRTPLHLAAAEGHLDVVEFPFEQGVSANLEDRWGGHPYDDAVSGGHNAVAERIVAAGGTAGSPRHCTDDPAPTQPSTQHGIADEMVELLWAAADNNVPGLRALVAHGVPLHAADYDGRTALHLAAAEGALEAARYLLAHGHPTGCRDRWGSTPLDEAQREDQPALVALLSATPAAGPR